MSDKDDALMTDPSCFRVIQHCFTSKRSGGYDDLDLTDGEDRPNNPTHLKGIYLLNKRRNHRKNELQSIYKYYRSYSFGSFAVK